jgi:membrane protein required for colicin V production
MVDLIVGVIVFLFFLLGLREGIVKSLLSVGAVFVSLFLASNALNYLATETPQFGDPNYIWTTIVFMIVAAISYLFLDLILTLLLKKIVTIIVLGPVDKIGGVLVGGFKGLLICGIALQLILALPISAQTRGLIKESKLSLLSISIYQWAFPQVKKIAPQLGGLIKMDLTQEMSKVEKIVPKENAGKETTAEDVMESISESGEEIKKLGEKAQQLLKEKKILISVPEMSGEEK